MKNSFLLPLIPMYGITFLPNTLRSAQKTFTSVHFFFPQTERNMSFRHTTSAHLFTPARKWSLLSVLWVRLSMGETHISSYVSYKMIISQRHATSAPAGLRMPPAEGKQEYILITI